MVFPFLPYVRLDQCLLFCSHKMIRDRWYKIIVQYEAEQININFNNLGINNLQKKVGSKANPPYQLSLKSRVNIPTLIIPAMPIPLSDPGAIINISPANVQA